VEEIRIGVNLDEHSIDFFGGSDHKAPLISLGRCALSELKMTNSEGLIELWVKAEHECTDALHSFVKEYAYQRLWVEFAPRQASLPEMQPKPKESAKVKGPTLM
jgi:hypothetical protein